MRKCVYDWSLIQFARVSNPVLAGLESVRYVIAGRVGLNPGMNKTRLKNVCVVHAWGCNFEKRSLVVESVWICNGDCSVVCLSSRKSCLFVVEEE